MKILKTDNLKEYTISDNDYAYIQEIKTILLMMDFEIYEVLSESIFGPRYCMVIRGLKKGYFVFNIEVCFSNVTLKNFMQWSHLRIIKGGRVLDTTKNKHAGIKYVNQYIQQYYEMSEL